MARLRDGGSGDPALWMKARKESAGAGIATSQTLVETLVRLYEAEEVIAELAEKAEDAISCKDCGGKKVCARCDETDICDSCGCAMGPTCSECLENG